MKVRFPETEASFSFKVNLSLEVTHTKNNQLTNCTKFENCLLKTHFYFYVVGKEHSGYRTKQEINK